VSKSFNTLTVEEIEHRHQRMGQNSCSWRFLFPPDRGAWRLAGVPAVPASA